MSRLLLGVFCLLSACFTSAAPLQLALNWKPESQFGGFYEAQADGQFSKQGLDVKLLEGGSGTPTVQMLAAGKVDYAIVSGDEIVIAHDRGATNIVAIFATYQTNPQGIMTHQERGFATLADVFRSEGILLWQQGLPYAQYLKKKYGPMQPTSAPYLGGLGTFQNDPRVAQQCFVTSEPIIATKAGLRVQTFLVADSGYNPYTTVLATTWERLEKNPAEVQKMVAAVRAGWGAYLASPAKTNAEMAALNKATDVAMLAASADAQKRLIETPQTVKLGMMETSRWRQLVDQLRELGIVRKAVGISELYVNM